jgi:alkylation response protein AidB-like acyl-CoA dehydrogenase
MCLARTNPDVPKHRGLTWFAVPTTAKGVTVQPITEINGEAEFCQEFFDDVELSDGDIIGEVDQGWRVAQTMLVFERGAGRAGPASPPALELAPDLVALARRVERDQDPVVRQLIATASTNDYAQIQLAIRIGSRLARSGMDAGVAAYGKLASGTYDPIRAGIGMRIGGTESLLWESGDLEGMRSALNFLNGRVQSIAGGTNEMQRNGIGERALGLPREPSFDTNKPFSEVIRSSRNWNGQVG